MCLPQNHTVFWMNEYFHVLQGKMWTMLTFFVSNKNVFGPDFFLLIRINNQSIHYLSFCSFLSSLYPFSFHFLSVFLLFYLFFFFLISPSLYFLSLFTWFFLHQFSPSHSLCCFFWLSFSLFYPPFSKPTTYFMRVSSINQLHLKFPTNQMTILNFILDFCLNWLDFSREKFFR